MASRRAIFRLTISDGAGVGKFYIRTEASRDGSPYQLFPTQGPFASREEAISAANAFAAEAGKLIDWNGSIGAFEVDR